LKDESGLQNFGDIVKYKILVIFILILSSFSCRHDEQSIDNDTKRNEGRKVTDKFINNPFSFKIIEEIDGDFLSLHPISNDPIFLSDNLFIGSHYEHFIKLDGIFIAIEAKKASGRGSATYSVTSEKVKLTNGIHLGMEPEEVLDLLGKPDKSMLGRITYYSKESKSINFDFIHDKLVMIVWFNTK
jgi:hypothetical protein